MALSAVDLTIGRRNPGFRLPGEVPTVRFAGCNGSWPRVGQSCHSWPAGGKPRNGRTDNTDQIVADVITARKLNLAGSWQISFDREEDVILHRRKSLSAHPNGMTFTAFSADGTLLREGTFYSVGGGFVVNEHGHAGMRAQRMP